MKNILYIILIIAIVIFIIFIGRNWNAIKNYLSGSSGNSNEQPLAEGSACITNDNNQGSIVSGLCVPIAQENPAPKPIAQNDLQVSNPNGAIMYYQSDLASGGKLYSPSNVTIPYGTKLKHIKTFQTNVSTQPFAGFYETDYKKYGAESGFFATKDIIKIN